ncbi:MAG TPA: Zn-ribbon domain-containing OB-fold protein [Stellaceae bacterium]|jgi:hypothetical protein|nr:Zn-ribbon domain-containing OB-fold protein [Stellaceae bacterium]
MAERKISPPAINPETKPFWDAAAKGQLLVKKCLACGELHYYPRSLCPFCHSDRTEWLAASGQGTIYSWSVMRRAPEPYAIAYVTLAEGPRMLTNIVDCSFDDLKIGNAVTLVWKPSEGGPAVPMFTLA